LNRVVFDQRSWPEVAPPQAAERVM
jgi:hypothetical protein